jgi:fructose-1,6-bisphosphatase
MKMCIKCKRYAEDDISINSFGICTRKLTVVDKYYKHKKRCRYYKKKRSRKEL